MSLLAPTAANACRVPPRPAALQHIEADAIVLAQITSVEGDADIWQAKASPRGVLIGSIRDGDIQFGRQEPIIISCDQWTRPKLERYYVLYIVNSENGPEVRHFYAFWWARMSGNVRLARLNEFMPLGAARPATPDEENMLELVEPRVRERERNGREIDASRYTRVYARNSASSFWGVMIPSEAPQRLMVDSREELPTSESCKCDLVEVAADLDDLWAAGKLPPFNP